MTSSSPSGQDRDVPMSQSSGHTHYAGMGMCVQCNPGWHVIPDPSNAIMGCDECGHARREHSREAGVGCLHELTELVQFQVRRYTCPCLRAGSSGADQ